MAYCYGENNDKIFESLIFSSLDGNYYWRDLDKEIDFIQFNKKEILPIEIKNKENLNERDFSTLKLFMQKFNLKKAILIYLGKKKVRTDENKKIELISFWDFLLDANH